MNKIETIVGVMEAFDEAERLERENAELRRRNAEIAGDGARPRWFADVYGYGRRAIFEKYTREWHVGVNARRNEDGTLRAESFAQWFKDSYSEFPDFMSREDFLAEFEPELKATYEMELAEALGEE